MVTTLPVAGACGSEARGERAGIPQRDRRAAGEAESASGQEHGAESPVEEVQPPERH